ncbi:MAG: hypothetical protein INR70_39620, partial [Parafilimonas terrae]|nr:hypothetical protein [Parafilimonas terrae]
MAVIVVMAVTVIMAVIVAMAVAVVMAVIVAVVMCVVIVAVLVMCMAVVMVAVTVVVVTVIVAAGAVVVGHLLRAEGAAHRSGRATLAAHQLGRRGGGRHVQHVGPDLGRDMVAAELPGEAHEPGGILRANLQQILGSRPHDDQPAVFQLE